MSPIAASSVLLAVLVRLIVPSATGPTCPSAPLLGLPPGFNGVEVRRLQGPNRQTTAIAISRDTFKALDSASAVVLARDNLFPDGLAGGPFARRVNAPLLLVNSTAISNEVFAEIERVLDPARTIYLLGAAQALDPAIESQLEARGYFNHVRLAGPTRYDTAMRIAEQFPINVDEVGMASGENFPDALSLGAPAARFDFPLLLTRKSSLPDVTRQYLQQHSDVQLVYIAGGPAAIEEGVANDLGALVGGVSHVRRYWGQDRYATSAAIVQGFYTDPVCAIAIATGEKFADAETAGAHAGFYQMPLALVRKDAVPDSTRQLLEQFAPGLDVVFIYGGFAAITQATEQAILEAATP